jgi:RNA polymerase sigma-70 factor (ECF subfamily)
LTEKELVTGCIKKDAKSQRMLFEQYAGKMMTICRRYACDQKEAEDMLQEAFIRVFTYIHQYKFEGPLGAWLMRIAVNSALKILQNKKIHFSEIRESQQTFNAVDPHALSNLSEDELLKLISNLPEGYRIVFNLYVLEGYSHEEIARLLDIRPATSRSQLSKARRMLQEQISPLQKIVK